MKNLKLLSALLVLAYAQQAFPGPEKDLVGDSGVFDVVEAELSEIVDLDKVKKFKEAYNDTEPLDLGYLALDLGYTRPNPGGPIKTYLEAAQWLAHVQKGHYNQRCSVDYVSARPIKRNFGKVFKKHPCSLFTKPHLELMPPDLSKNLDLTIQHCIRRGQNIKQAESFVVDPSLEYSVRLFHYGAPHIYMSPKEAFEMLQDAAQSERKSGEENTGVIIKLFYNKPSEPTTLLGRFASLWRTSKPIETEIEIEKVKFELPLQAAVKFLNRFTKKQN